MPRLLLPVATRASTSASRLVSPPGRLGAAIPESLHPGEVWRGAQLVETQRAASSSICAVTSSPILRAGEHDQDPAARGVIRRIELAPGPPSTAQCVEGGAASPSASRTPPAARSDTACRSGASRSVAISDSSSAAMRAAQTSFAASMISTYADQHPLLGLGGAQQFGRGGVVEGLGQRVVLAGQVASDDRSGVDHVVDRASGHHVGRRLLCRNPRRRHRR
jgi:hypothetical protein